jgi:hypothetical protein
MRERGRYPQADDSGQQWQNEPEVFSHSRPSYSFDNIPTDEESECQTFVVGCQGTTDDTYRKLSFFHFRHLFKNL